jgi:hypothetical protein
MTVRRAMALIPLVVLSAALLLAPGAMAKKGKKNANLFSQQLTLNSGIPDRPAGNSVSTPLVSTITVPKAFKGRTVADVNVTNLQTTGSALTSAGQLVAYLTGPSGRTLQLFLMVGGQSMGPWTMDDDTSIAICNAAPPGCTDPSQSLTRPFAGTSNMTQNWQGSFAVNGALSIFDRQGMRGAWTLRVADLTNGSTSVLNQWGLQIRAKVAR